MRDRMSKTISSDQRGEPPSDHLTCSKAGRCSGCDLIGLNRSTLADERKATLQRLGLESVPVETRWIQTGGLRDRLEFTLESDGSKTRPAKLGLFELKSDIDGSRDLIDIDICPQLSPNLQTWLTDFRKDLPPLRSRGSVRLRVSPDDRRGVWLDFANEDILHLLEEASWLERQIEAGVLVEMGQKRKRVVRTAAAAPASNDAVPEVGLRAHKLSDPQFEPWFQSWIRSDNGLSLSPTPLFGTIGTFTQPGFRANRVLIETVLQHADLDLSKKHENLRVAEFGAGIGSFTLPLLSTGAAVHVFESDRIALEALDLGVTAARLNRGRLTVHTGDFILSSKAAQKANAEMKKSSETETAAPTSFDLVVVDPPRPGLGDFIPSLAEKTRGARWVYVSCFPESFAKDRLELRRHDLELERITIVEQFPFTRHFEIVASFVPRGASESR